MPIFCAGFTIFFQPEQADFDRLAAISIATLLHLDDRHKSDRHNSDRHGDGGSGS